jgi:ElaB/YqjD/DUF883 family membrane-anchored ribosome-binding protein
MSHLELEDIIQLHPLKAVAIAVLIGLIVGMLVA